MQQCTKMVRELALANGGVTNDTFLLSSVIMNIFRKCAQHFWKKHPSNPISVRMWTLEKPCNVFFYQDHSLMDLNCTTQNGVPFNLKIQTEWQSEMMAKFSHNIALLIDVKFGSIQIRLLHFPSYIFFIVFNCVYVLVCYSNPIPFLLGIYIKYNLFVAISIVHRYGF